MTRVASQTLLAVLCGSLLALSLPASAQTKATLLAKNGDWEAYTYSDKSGPVCYMAAIPKNSQNAPANRGMATLSVTHRSKELNVVSVAAGFTFKKDSTAEMTVGSKKFSLFTNGSGAWARDSATDKAVVQAMIKANDAVINGTPAKGKAVVDTFSMAGFSASYEAINQACGVK